MELPADVDEFDVILRRRIRDQDAIDEYHDDASRGRKLDPKLNSLILTQQIKHTVGQSGCFCMECLVHRKQEWRIGNVNSSIVGPRDQWRQYAWGNTDRKALYCEDTVEPAVEPMLTPSIKEFVRVHDRRRRQLTIERDAKFTAVASGKFHTLMLSESTAVFACGDNSHGALGFPHSPHAADMSTPTPTKVEVTMSRLKGSVQMVAASGYASFALVVVPVSDSRQPPPTEEVKKTLARRMSINMTKARFKVDDLKEKFVYNYLLSWGRGDHGVLGHGDTESSSVPRIIEMFNSRRVLQVSAGLHHVLVLTDSDGAFAFGHGRYGKLGTGDEENRCSPCKIFGLDGLNVIHVSAGDDHSIAMTGESFFNRQVYSWGCGSNGRLGHNDELLRIKPTRINFFRGRKVITVSAGGAHNLATSEATNGIFVWSWGSGTYGQLGHRDTWDALLPRSIDEIRRSSIRFIDAGERHSLAISEARELWVWGQGVHGNYDVPRPNYSSTSILYPIKIDIPGIHMVSAKAGRGRTFVWGDKAVGAYIKPRSFGGSSASEFCSALVEHEGITSDSFRIIYRCGPCKLDTVCIACAHHCHVQHCLELTWTLEDTLSKECNCFESGKCVFDTEGDTQAELDD